MPLIENCRLRPAQQDDLAKILKWRNTSRIRAVMFTDRTITADEHRAWFERLQEEKSAYCMVFEFQVRPVGVVNIVQIDRHSNKCSWGFYLGEIDVPRGIGAVMGYLALEYIFEVLSIRKLCSEVLAFNTRSIRFHEKMGFVKEGHLAKHVLKNGSYEDVVVMAHFHESWIKSKNKLKEICFGGVKLS